MGGTGQCRPDGDRGPQRVLDGGKLTCTKHGWQFDICAAACTARGKK